MRALPSRVGSLASLAAPEVVPVRGDLAALFPWGGLRRGSTVAVRGSVALLLALLVEVTEGGGWVALVGVPQVGLLAAAEMGVRVERVVVVPSPGAEFASTVAALLDGVDVVAVSGARVVDSLARKLSARARGRGAVLLSFGAWPGAEVELAREGDRWWGLGVGHGRLRGRVTGVVARGRGAAARPRRCDVVLQGESEPGRLTFDMIEHTFESNVGGVERGSTS
ncbi:hypothetical protein [Actinokineospora pegani]|uniref:hypothetical protein n=1 Tax=Actinokineospora pegani TaxID=2654637 RepID=UPI0018D4B41B|nr:hypothetical protein [Actinokineospora pegani]